ncbi:SpoIVB peptidase S55 [Edaphobacter bradus]|uniref:SpoIVB peptidase S55 n=1 Tax=Edaphobacter bradus TaxID=2259016 RepID=UPI0021E0EDDE|nr:SpoIVB peptidase S55 [Edaphobacter bradus]
MKSHTREGGSSEYGLVLWPKSSTLVDVIASGKTRWLACLALGWGLTGILRAQTMTASADGNSFSAALPASPPAETRIFPLSEVKQGLEGVAYTVFQGVSPEPMRVEILGVLKDALGPGEDMILARLHGQKPEYTGVVAGMSGSPVYIDGRLAGALSYRIGQFSKEPIAGITPIEQMLEVRDETISPAAAPITNQAATERQPEIRPMDTPLVFSGFTQDAVQRFGDRFRAMGLTPVAGLGGSDPKASQPEPLLPGSAVSAVLVQGDLSIAGTCTVTYVDASHLLACGHPITQYGPVAMPMTKAAVLATLPSPLNAFKIVNTTETVGAFTEDRSSAIMGRFGVKARMIPVIVDVTSPGNPARTKSYHFEVLDNRGLTPSAMLVSVYQSLQGNNSAAAEMSYRLSGQIAVEGHSPIQLNGIMAQNDLNPAPINAALYVTDRFSKVYGNALDQPTVTSLTLKVEEIPERRTAVIEDARLGRVVAFAGETIEVEATIHPYQAPPRIVRLPVRLPADIAPGSYRILISDGATVDRLLQPTGVVTHTVGLDDTITQVNRLHPNDRVFMTLLDHTAQAVLEGDALPGLPLSMANVLGPLKEAQKMQLTGESVVDLGSVETGYSVAGSRVLTLTVR